MIGKPWGQQFGYIALGYFKDEEDLANSPKQINNPRVGDLKYKDINGDGIVNTEDYVLTSSLRHPKRRSGQRAVKSPLFWREHHSLDHDLVI